eukprot:3468711-Pyramimonas_sp.AAC.1
MTDRSDTGKTRPKSERAKGLSEGLDSCAEPRVLPKGSMGAQSITWRLREMPCHAMQCHAMPCNAMPCHAMQCHAMPCNAMQCDAMRCEPRKRGVSATAAVRQARARWVCACVLAFGPRRISSHAGSLMSILLCKKSIHLCEKSIRTCVRSCGWRPGS